MTDRFLDLAERNVEVLRLTPRTNHELLEEAREAVEHDPWIAQRRTDEWRSLNRLWKIMMLAPTLEIGEALLRGDHVPIDRLDQHWVERFGLRHREAA